jgi:hypothetical protein
MFKKLLALLGFKSKPAAADSGAPAPAPNMPAAEPPPPGPIAPYAREDLNLVYNLLFCDDASLFKTTDDATRSLFVDGTEPKVVRAIADDRDEESRVRMLAYNWLHENAQPVPPKETLGVVIEVPLEQGLDVLAAYADGTVRYINHMGSISVYESHPAEIAAQAKEIVATAQSMVIQQPAGTRRRQAPPTLGDVRLTALVSDGLYVGQGAFEAIATGKQTAPVLQGAQKLLDLIVRQGRPKAD